jgi:hypothetical protein
LKGEQLRPGGRVFAIGHPVLDRLRRLEQRRYRFTQLSHTLTPLRVRWREETDPQVGHIRTLGCTKRAPIRSSIRAGAHGITITQEQS